MVEAYPVRPFVHTCSDELRSLIEHARVSGVLDNLKFFRSTEVTVVLVCRGVLV